MSDFNWKSVVGAVAPLLGGALGGPFGALAAKKVAGALLGNEDASQDEIEVAIQNASPDQLLALKNADNEFKTTMEELGIKKEQVHAGDRDSARQREIATKDDAPKILASVVVLGFFATLGTIAFADIPDKAMPAVNILLGALTALLVQVGNYYFGSSAGSKAKTVLLGKTPPR